MGASHPGLEWVFFGKNAELGEGVARERLGKKTTRVLWKITIHFRGRQPVHTLLSPLDVAKYFYAEKSLSEKERAQVMREFGEKVYSIADGNLLRLLGDYLYGLKEYRGLIGPSARLLWKAPLFGVKEVLGLREEIERPREFEKLEKMMHLRFKRVMEFRLQEQRDFEGDEAFVLLTPTCCDSTLLI